MNTPENSREIRLRRAAQRQGLSLHKSRTRDPRALGYGLFHLADAEYRIVAGGDYSGYSMSLDAVEVYLADAQDFDVYFGDPLGDYRPDDHRPILEWTDGYAGMSGWLLTERSDSPREHFFFGYRLPTAALAARTVCARWAGGSAA